MFNNSEQSFLSNLLSRGLRPDGRQLFTQRIVQIQFMEKPGCLLFKQGQTKVMIKISTEITSPKNQRPSQGFVMFRVNCQAASNNHEKNKKLSNEINKLLQKIIIGSNTLDPESLCIISGRYVWQLIIDCIVVKDDGNLIDSILNASVVALMDAKKPLIQIQNNNILVKQKLQMLSLAHTPFTFTFGLINDSIFMDPTSKQEAVSETSLSITMNVYNEICCIHKPGGLGITQKILGSAILVCQKKIKSFTEQIRKKQKERKSVLMFF